MLPMATGKRSVMLVALVTPGTFYQVPWWVNRFHEKVEAPVATLLRFLSGSNSLSDRRHCRLCSGASGGSRHTFGSGHVFSSACQLPAML